MNNAALERLSSITERVQARPAAAALEQAPAKKEAYRWKATTVVEETKVEVATPKALKKALEHEKTPELAAKLAEEAVERDSWAAEVSQLAVPRAGRAGGAQRVERAGGQPRLSASASQPAPPQFRQRAAKAGWKRWGVVRYAG